MKKVLTILAVALTLILVSSVNVNAQEVTQEKEISQWKAHSAQVYQARVERMEQFLAAHPEIDQKKMKEFHAKRMEQFRTERSQRQGQMHAQRHMNERTNRSQKCSQQKMRHQRGK